MIMSEWLSTFNKAMGMHNSAIITTIFGAFCVTFAVCICWPKMVETFGPIGGMMCAAIIVGTFWVMNHKLPGFGINPELLKDAEGNGLQFGLIHQGMRGAAAWIDMGWAIGMGMWVMGMVQARAGERFACVKESVPRVLLVILGGLIGGAIVGLTGYTGADLFGWGDSPMLPGK